MQRQQELHQTKKFHLPVFLKYSIECRQSSFTCGIHDRRGLRFSLLNGVFMWICHQVTFQEIVSEPQTPFCPASYLYFTAKFILRNETSTAFISETGRFPIVKFRQIRCFNLKLERIKKSKQSEKVTLASRNTLIQFLYCKRALNKQLNLSTVNNQIREFDWLKLQSRFSNLEFKIRVRV